MVGPVFFLDVNALLALFWPTHEHHAKIQSWFRADKRRWATCPITQAGFVRLASNPLITRDAVSVSEAIKLLGANLEHPGHVFWTDDLEIQAALSQFGGHIQGYRQVTDAYLLALAIRHKAQLVTFDSGIAALSPPGLRGSTQVIDLAGRIPRN